MVREYLTGIQHCMHIWPYSGIYHSQDNLQTIAIHTLYTFLLVGYRISEQSTEFQNGYNIKCKNVSQAFACILTVFAS